MILEDLLPERTTVALAVKDGIYPPSVFFMAIFHIAYDLNSPGQGYAKVIKAIQSIGPFFHVLASSWLVQSGASASQIRDHLLLTVDGNDKFIVSRIRSGEWASANLDQKTVDWLILNA